MAVKCLQYILITFTWTVKQLLWSWHGFVSNESDTTKKKNVKKKKIPQENRKEEIEELAKDA